MKKYIIAVGSPEISREVQEALFRAGFHWMVDDQNIRSPSSRFLSLNWCDDVGCITHSNSSASETAGILKEGAILISSQEVIADPFQLDGATKPTVDMTMEDLEKHFGHPVKITKKK